MLVQLDNSPGLSQAELARRSLLTPQSMGEVLVPPERAGCWPPTGVPIWLPVHAVDGVDDGVLPDRFVGDATVTTNLGTAA